MRYPNQKHLFPVERKVYRDSASITKVENEMLNANLIGFFCRLRLPSHVTSASFFRKLHGNPTSVNPRKCGLEVGVGTCLAADSRHIYPCDPMTKKSQDCQSFRHNKYVIQEIKKKNKATKSHQPHRPSYLLKNERFLKP